MYSYDGGCGNQQRDNNNGLKTILIYFNLDYMVFGWRRGNITGLEERSLSNFQTI